MAHKTDNFNLKLEKMKRVKITANELDHAEAWLKDIDFDQSDLPMLLASYGRDVKLEKFPALLNLSDEIGNLAEKIKGMRYGDLVSIRLSEYNRLRDFEKQITNQVFDIVGVDLNFFRTVPEKIDMLKEELIRLRSLVKPSDAIIEPKKKNIFGF
jgi:hypothetical protein